MTIDIDAIRARAEVAYMITQANGGFHWRFPENVELPDIPALLAELEAKDAEIAAIRVELDEAKAERDNWWDAQHAEQMLRSRP